MSEDLNAMTPAERELWRARKVQEEEEQYQARMQRQAELQTRRTEAFNRAKEQAKRFSDRLRDGFQLVFMAEGRAREAKIQAGLIQKPGIIRGRFWGFEAPNCGMFGDVPGGIARIREVFATVQHPKTLPLFKEKGTLYCQRHYANHQAVLVFKGLQLSDLDIEPCVCVEGPGHQFKNISTSLLNSAPWTFEPGQEFDAPPGAEEDIEAYLSIGFVEDLKAPRKKAKKKEAKPKTSEEILEQAIAAWERGDG